MYLIEISSNDIFLYNIGLYIRAVRCNLIGNNAEIVRKNHTHTRTSTSYGTQQFNNLIFSICFGTSA